MERNKRMIRGAMLLLFLFLLLTGCGKRETTTDIWVVTEETEWNGMNYQVRLMIEDFQQRHPGINIKLDILPTEPVTRADYLKGLRTMIMGGRGPDVFLLPTSTTLHGKTYKNNDIDRIRDLEPLFMDVEQAKRNGLFADISAYYDNDTTLGTDHFNEQIMDAGTYEGGRYILPLRYNFPVLYVDTLKLSEWGLSKEHLDGNILELLDIAISSGDQKLACGVEPFYLRAERGFSTLGSIIDYDAEEVLVTKNEISALLRRVQQLETLVGELDEHRRKMDIGNFTQSYEKILEFGMSGRPIGTRTINNFPLVFPMQVGFLDDAALVTTVSEAAEREFASIPLRGVNGEIAAYVTYYGAIGAGCTDVALAYDFLRLFLTERTQYEQDNPAKASFLAHGQQLRYRYIEDGWPVRTKNGTNQMYSIVRQIARFAFPDEGALHIKPRMLLVYRMTDEDMPLLETEFDCVYFGSVLEQKFARMVRSLNDPVTGEPTDVDIDAMAENFVKELRWQIMEG